MSTLIELTRKLRSPENRRILEAVEELRVRGWLSDGSLAGIALCHAHMEGADLLGADLHSVDFHQASFQGADLSRANLSGTKLSRADLRDTNLSETDFTNADSFKVNFAGARNLEQKQLARSKRLWGAIMPDGKTYDGRFNLPGDLDFAHWGGVAIDDPQAMADFFRISLEDYRRGQELGKKVAT